jgi:4-diphosphocytidyl-2-C-methyl-D-erythritol kinase
MLVKNEKLSIIAPAKLNLYLKVLDRRPDGFHNLDSVFLAVDFCDKIHFLSIDKHKFSDILMNWTYGNINPENIPKEKNIIFKALSLFSEKIGFDHGFKIFVDKRIPIGSGLGGGSSDAASTLLALNKLAGFPLTRNELLELAGILGSDVPFFIYETQAARVKGRGEFITPLEAPYRFFVLVNPGISSNTTAAYKILDEYRKKNCDKKKGFSNDFLSCFDGPEKSVYNTIIFGLQQLGADFANLSGTGSTCFGAFIKEEDARKAADVLRAKWKFVEFCKINYCSHCEQ